jgi:hypothetical protein
MFTAVPEEDITSIVTVQFYPEDGNDTLLRNIGKHLPEYTESHRTGQQPL